MSWLVFGLRLSLCIHAVRCHLMGVIACGVFAGRCCPSCTSEDGLGTTSQALLPAGCSLDVVVQGVPWKMGWVPPYRRYCLWGVRWTLLSSVCLRRWVGYHLTGVIACGVFAGRCCPGCALEDGSGTTSQALLPAGCSLDVVVQRVPRKMGRVPPHRRYCLWGVRWTLLSSVRLGRWVRYHLFSISYMSSRWKCYLCFRTGLVC